jgi:hypothetical protein
VADPGLPPRPGRLRGPVAGRRAAHRRHRPPTPPAGCRSPTA